MSQHIELIARLQRIAEWFDLHDEFSFSEEPATIREAADALQALEPTLDAAAALGNLTTKREKVILLSRAQKENELLRAKIATQELRLEDANGLLRYVADQRDAALSKLQSLERVPMTGDQIISATSRIDTQEYGWVLKIVRAIEAHHGITPPESI